MGKSGLTTHRRGAIWTERMLLGLILVSLGGTLNLLVAIHRRAAAEHREAIPAAPEIAQAAERGPASEPASQSSNPVESPAIAQKTEPPAPPPEEEDPTQKAIAPLAAAKAKEIEAAEATDSRTASLEAAYRSAVAESQLWKRREMLVRQQIAGINVQAEKLERDADALDAERDVLERERDATKAALAKAGKRSGFAVLPYKGPNGTWRRPIVIECTRGGANLQPHGPTFTPLELSPRIHPRSSTFIKAIARELFHIQSADTPDGTPAVPYIVFLVRPDGIAPYYLARTCLEPLGIAFGYELVAQNLAINIPDFDDLTSWDGSLPLDVPLERAPVAGSTNRRLAQANQPDDQMRTSLAGLPPGDSGSMIGAIDGNGRGGGGQGMSSSGSSEPQDFVWPGRGRPATQDGQRSAGASGAGESGSLAGRDSVNPSTDRGAGGTKPEGGAGALGPLTGPDLARADQNGLVGSPGKSGTTKAGGSDEGVSGGLAGGSSVGRGLGDQAGGGSGDLAVGSSGGPGSGGQPGGLGSGMTAGVVNAEDVGTGAGADAAFQPFPGSGAGTGGLNTGGGALNSGGGALNTGGSGSGGGSGSADSIFQVPAFEPANDQAGGSASLGQPGLLSGRGSSGGRGPGVQAPAFGLGQTIKGSSSTPGGDDGSAGIGGSLPQSGGGAMSAGGGRSGLSAAGSGSGSGSGQPGGGNAGTNGSASGAGSGVPSTGSDPASGGAPDANSTGTGGRGTGQGGRGFDWSEAAKDGPPPSGSDAAGLRPAARLRADRHRRWSPIDRGCRCRECVGRRCAEPIEPAGERSSGPGEHSVPARPDFAGRHRSCPQLERTQLVREPGPGPEAFGRGFGVRFPIRNAVELLAE